MKTKRIPLLAKESKLIMNSRRLSGAHPEKAKMFIYVPLRNGTIFLVL